MANLAISKKQAQNFKKGVYLGSISGAMNKDDATEFLLNKFPEVETFSVKCDDEEHGVFDLMANFSKTGVYLNGVYMAEEILPEEKDEYFFFEGEIKERFGRHNAAHVINERGLRQQIK